MVVAFGMNFSFSFIDGIGKYQVIQGFNQALFEKLELVIGSYEGSTIKYGCTLPSCFNETGAMEYFQVVTQSGLG